MIILNILNYNLSLFNFIYFYISILWIYFDKTFRPLHAIFVFNEKNSLHKERKLFSGGYNADEFTSFCSEMIKKNTPVKVELLVNIVDMSYEEGLHLEGINKDLLIDIYFLIDIFNDA